MFPNYAQFGLLMSMKMLDHWPDRMRWSGNWMAWMQLSRITCTSDFSYQLQLIQHSVSIQSYSCFLFCFQPMAFVFQESVVWGHWKAKLKYLLIIFSSSLMCICWTLPRDTCRIVLSPFAKSTTKSAARRVTSQALSPLSSLQQQFEIPKATWRYLKVS